MKLLTSLGKMLALSILHGNFSQVRVLNILLKKVIMLYSQINIFSGWINMVCARLFSSLVTRMKITWTRVNRFLFLLLFILGYFTIKSATGLHVFNLLAVGNTIDIRKRLIFKTSSCYCWYVGENAFKIFPFGLERKCYSWRTKPASHIE